MDVILNIGLNVANGNNEFDARSERAEVATRYLTSVFSRVVSKRLLTTYTNDNQPVIEDTLVVHLVDVNPQAGSVYSAVFNLADLLAQDCIAAFFPDVDSGLLIGPRADAWGEFNKEFFRTIDELTKKPTTAAGATRAA